MAMCKKWQTEHPLKIGTDDEPIPGVMLKLIEEEHVCYAEHLTEEETTSLSKAKQQKEDRRQAAILRDASM